MTNVSTDSQQDTSVKSAALDNLIEGTNVRTAFNDLAALTESIKSSGILQPLLVRPKGQKYEVVCGHRRFAAAKALGLESVPVMVRDLNNAQALEAQIVENDQREDAHPLDQAQGYRALMEMAKLDVAGVAARVGRPESHVYDRVRLLGLSKPAQKLFRDGAIAVGHAVLLARLKPADQARAIGQGGGLFQHEDVLELEGETEHRKARTVRELQGWIDKHVRLDVAASDLPQLFPAAAVAISSAREISTKIVPITHTHFVHPDAKDGAVRTYGPQSWRRADGVLKSKRCERSVLGVVVAGPDRGTTLEVCIDRKKCAMHFPDQARAAARVAKGLAKERPASTSAKREAAAHAKHMAARKLSGARYSQWKRASPEILKLIAGATAKAKASATGPAADLLVASMRSFHMPKAGLALMKRGKTAEDLVRYLTFLLLGEQVSQYYAFERAPKYLKPLGIDVTKALAKFPLETKAAAKPADGEEEE